MRYFTEADINKDQKIGITNLLGDITQRSGSHKGGWTRLLKCQLANAGYENVSVLNKDDLSDFDVIIFDLGAEFSGGLNMFGGLDEKVDNRLLQLRHFQGKFFSWKHELPDIMTLQGRRSNQSTCEAFKTRGDEFLPLLQERLQTAKVFQHVEPKRQILIGDSHTPGMWTPDMEIHRQDGRTLFGSLKKDLIKEVNVDEYEHIVVHMSSIDIRHHIVRQENPQESIIQLILKLEKDLLSLKPKSVTLCETMGIETEQRKLPKTGYYKGTPFYGTWEERNGLKNLFNEAITRIAKRNNWNVKKYPETFFENNDKVMGQLKEEVMEKPKSVHISPEYYSWDLDNNKARW